MSNKHHDNVFLRHSVHTAAPWLVKAHHKQRRIIQGLHGEPIGEIYAHGNPEISNEQYRANCNTIQHAPQLLAALKEIAVIIENANNTQHKDKQGNTRDHYVREAFPNTTKLKELINSAESTQLVDRPSNE
jgi:hypothetical protein